MESDKTQLLGWSQTSSSSFGGVRPDPAPGVVSDLPQVLVWSWSISSFRDKTEIEGELKIRIMGGVGSGLAPPPGLLVLHLYQ